MILSQTSLVKIRENFWILISLATHRLVMMIIPAKLVSNPTIHNKVMGRTRTSFAGLPVFQENPSNSQGGVAIMNSFL